MDLEKARKDQEPEPAEERGEDALFYPVEPVDEQLPTSQCVCTRYNTASGDRIPVPVHTGATMASALIGQVSH